MNNPELHNRFHLMLRGTVLLAVLCALVWVGFGFKANQDGNQILVDPQVGGLGLTESQSEQTAQTFTTASFEVILWHAPPPIEIPRSVKTKKPARVSFQLLAISTLIDDTGNPIKQGVIYDPSEDKVHTLSIGQSISGYTVSEIQDDSVSLSQDTKTIRLVLESGESG